MSANPPQLTVVILTFNSAAIIGETVAQARKLTDDIYVVDSGSTDGTLQILEANACRIAQRPFVHYADQRNWAIEQLRDGRPWQLHLDADEVLDDKAVSSVKSALDGAGGIEGFMLLRKTFFMGRQLNFGGGDTWHLRLFRSGKGRCEDRLYDQHFICDGNVSRLGGSLLDKNVSTLTEWTARHNKWSDLEARQVLGSDEASSGALQPNLFGDPRERKRSLKSTYYKMPKDLRVVAYFLYRYVGQLGFLDGRVGFYYAVFQALWFRLLVDAKITELQQAASNR